MRKLRTDERQGRMRSLLVAGIAPPLLLLEASVSVQRLDPDSRFVSSKSVAGVRVESIAESDGGLLVRMRRKGRGHSFEYSLEYWRGNGGVVVGATFRRGECRSGDADIIQPAEDAMARATLDFRLSEYLRECPLAPPRERELRQSLAAAWPAFSRLAEAAWAATNAENQAIADYGKEE